MNERIRQLAEQCRGNPMTSEFEPRFDREKFAELIVRQCAEICLEANDHKNILRYFGVEE
jgi:hypothetical protein